jgi:nuclear pore complex protein Nup188
MASTSVTSGSPVIPAAAALYFSLEDAASRGLSHDELAKLLDESADFLCGCLGSYKAPNARSKAEVESGSVQYGGEKRSLNASIREVTIAASKKLNLDEVQTYALLRRCLAEDGSSAPAQPTSLDDDLAERLTTYYFRERLSVLKCVHALLMHAQAVDDDRTTTLVSTTLERMLDKGLEANLVDGICAHLLGETPARPEDAKKNPSVSKDWSELALEETRVMLECVFLMY